MKESIFVIAGIALDKVMATVGEQPFLRRLRARVARARIRAAGGRLGLSARVLHVGKDFD